MKDQWKDAAGKKKIELQGGTGVGYGMRCGGAFAVGG